MWKQKLTETLGSRNFLITITTIVVGIFTANGIEVPGTPDDILGIFTNYPIGEALSILIANYLNVTVTLAKKILSGDFDKSFLNSTNFWTQVGTGTMILLGMFSGNVLVSILISLVAQILNLLYHLQLPVKKINT